MIEAEDKLRGRRMRLRRGEDGWMFEGMSRRPIVLFVGPLLGFTVSFQSPDETELDFAGTQANKG
jgi:hypothetical protein